jgi:hypothetical protein
MFATFAQPHNATKVPPAMTNDQGARTTDFENIRMEIVSMQHA